MIYFSYRKISECYGGFWTWLFFEWDFVNKESIREHGTILFGLTWTNYSEDESQRHRMIKLREKQYARLQEAY